MTTNEAFIKQKKANFCKWLNTLADEKYPKDITIKQKIVQLQEMPELEFTALCVNEMSAYSNNIDALIDKIIDGTSVKRADLSAEDLTKFQRYMQLFIKYAQS